MPGTKGRPVTPEAAARLYWDVAVVGGHPAPCAAIEAAEAGRRVVLSEGAPEGEFRDDLQKVARGRADEALARLCIRRSEDSLPGMGRHGVRFRGAPAGRCGSTAPTASSWAAERRW